MHVNARGSRWVAGRSRRREEARTEVQASNPVARHARTSVTQAGHRLRVSLLPAIVPGRPLNALLTNILCHHTPWRALLQERLTLKHKNTSRWARRALKRGQTLADAGTRAAVAEQLRLGEELRQRVRRQLTICRVCHACCLAAWPLGHALRSLLCSAAVLSCFLWQPRQSVDARQPLPLGHESHLPLWSARCRPQGRGSASRTPPLLTHALPALPLSPSPAGQPHEGPGLGLRCLHLCLGGRGGERG